MAEQDTFCSTHALAVLQGRIRACRVCEERGYIPVARPLTEGRSSDRILLVGQAPSRRAVSDGHPFVGPTGYVLDSWLRQAGFLQGALRTRIYLSTLMKCDPGKHPRAEGDRLPSPAELALCQPHLDAELRLLRPAVIVLLGSMAARRFLGRGRLEDVVGRTFSGDDLAYRPLWPDYMCARVLPLPHASTMSRWLNDPAHRALLVSALAHLGRWREELKL